MSFPQRQNISPPLRTSCVLMREPQNGRFQGDCHITDMAKSQGFIKKPLSRKSGVEWTEAARDVSVLVYVEKVPSSRMVGGKEWGKEEHSWNLDVGIGEHMPQILRLWVAAWDKTEAIHSEGPCKIQHFFFGKSLNSYVKLNRNHWMVSQL